MAFQTPLSILNDLPRPVHNGLRREECERSSEAREARAFEGQERREAGRGEELERIRLLQGNVDFWGPNGMPDYLLYDRIEDELPGTTEEDHVNMIIDFEADLHDHAADTLARECYIEEQALGYDVYYGTHAEQFDIDWVIYQNSMR